MKILSSFATFLCLLINFFNSHGQHNIENTIRKYNDHSIPYVTAKELNPQTDFIILDARKNEEFAVSRLPGAIWIGHKDFNAERIQTEIPDKNTPLVVYCSIGIRSEKIGNKLLKLGYKDVLNLHGGIFDWKNKGYPIYNSKNQETDSVHVYNKNWGELLTGGVKVYNQKEHK